MLLLQVPISLSVSPVSAASKCVSVRLRAANSAVPQVAIDNPTNFGAEPRAAGVAPGVICLRMVLPQLILVAVGMVYLHYSSHTYTCITSSSNILAHRAACQLEKLSRRNTQ